MVGVGTAAHEGGDGIHGDRGNENQQRPCGDAGPGERNDHAGKGAERSGAEVVGCLDEGVVEFLHAGVDGEDHEREIVVHEPENNREGGVHHANRGGDDVGGKEKAVGQPFLAEDRDPCVSADQEAGPEGNHHQREEKAAVSRAGPADGVGGGISDHNANQGCEQGVKDGGPENGQPGGIKTALVVVEGEGVDHPSHVVAPAETGGDQQGGGQEDKHAQPEEQGGEQEPRPPTGLMTRRRKTRPERIGVRSQGRTIFRPP